MVYPCFLTLDSHPHLSEVLQVSEHPVPGGVQSKAVPTRQHMVRLGFSLNPAGVCPYSSLGAWIRPLSPKGQPGKAPALPENVSEQLELFIRENLIRRLLFM